MPVISKSKMVPIKEAARTRAQQRLDAISSSIINAPAIELLNSLYAKVNDVCMLSIEGNVGNYHDGLITSWEMLNNIEAAMKAKQANFVRLHRVARSLDVK